MIEDAKKYLKDRKISDIEVESNYGRLIKDIIPLKYSLSELMHDYETQKKIIHERTRFTIDIRKPQFKWFLVLLVFCIIGILITVIKIVKFLIH